nr:MAG TPA: hypothetical protein [Caudoviricetes sp.]
MATLYMAPPHSGDPYRHATHHVWRTVTHITLDRVDTTQ